MPRHMRLGPATVASIGFIISSMLSIGGLARQLPVRHLLENRRPHLFSSSTFFWSFRHLRLLHLRFPLPCTTADHIGER